MNQSHQSECVRVERTLYGNWGTLCIRVGLVCVSTTLTVTSTGGWCVGDNYPTVIIHTTLGHTLCSNHQTENVYITQNLKLP